ncbi:IS200/IS605 family accessory protein TnpB-related protein [Streptomyces sp. NPDC005499]|uniref:IS200/IS605 family accessory protein TnpB-related protein n=1 Tax=Streptomyces sp. NPDC005499 TaxID=3154883 RepID=UPI0033BC44F7
MGGLRKLTASFVVSGPCGVAVRERLKHLTPEDEWVLRAIGAHQGALASRDLKTRCADGLEHGADSWAARPHRSEPGRGLPHPPDTGRGRWYLTASWQRPVIQTIPLETARARGMVGVDTNADHFAAYRLDRHGNPVGEPHRFGYDLSGTTSHRDAQIRHALTRLINWARCVGVAAIGIEDLDFATERTREKHGRRKRFRQLISGMPTGKLKARLVSMAAEHGLSVVAVDPAYTSLWGAQHWQKPLTTPRRKMSRHDAAGIAIGRRALGHPVRRRTAPPPHDRSDRAGHRTAQAAPGTRGREGTRPPTTDRPPEGRRRTGSESGNPVHPKPFGMHPARTSGSTTYLRTLATNGVRPGLGRRSHEVPCLVLGARPPGLRAARLRETGPRVNGRPVLQNDLV